MPAIRIAFAAILAQTALEGAAQDRPKRIYIANDDHTDYFWSGDDTAYCAAFLRQLDYYLDLADATEDNSPPFQSRWNCDGCYWLWEYERSKPPADFERLISRVRSGHIGVPLNALVSCYGGAPLEAVLRGMYYAGRLERRYGIRFHLAIAMENQTLPYGLGSLWAGVGARWTWRGVCACATRVPAPGDREHEMYWWVGPDGSRILVKWYNLLANDQLGGYAEARNPALAVDQCDAKCHTASYPYGVAGAFGKGWDELETMTDAFVRTAQSKTTADRRVFVSNIQDFFSDFESAHGSNLPSVGCTFGNEWDLYCASMAEVSAGVKRGVERLRAAEAMAALAGLHVGGFDSGDTAARERTWMNLGLYWEHCWTGDTSRALRDARAKWSRRISGEISDYASNLHERASAALAAQVRKSGESRSFMAFNPLSWTRSDYADLPFQAAGDAHVLDVAARVEAPSQIVTNAGQRRLRIWASDVPPTGYKVFEIMPGPGATFSPAATVAFTGTGAGSSAAMDNGVYEVEVHPRGAITRWTDKTMGNIQLAGLGNGLALNDLTPGDGTLTIEDFGPVSVTIRAESGAGRKHVSRVTLFRGSRRLAIRNEILENFGEILTWTFNFNLAEPDVWHEEVGAIIRARKRKDGGHYSDRVANSRYDWLTLNHFADMTGVQNGTTCGATLANADCFFFRLGDSGVSTLDTATPRIAVLAGGQVDGPGLGIPNQGGDSYFLQRFALRAHAGHDAPAAMRFALEFQNPLVASPVTGRENSPYSADSHSFLSISDGDVLLWALKPAEEGPDFGVIARVWNLALAPRTYTLEWTDPVTRAMAATHIETDIGEATIVDGKLHATAEPMQIMTWRLNSRSP